MADSNITKRALASALKEQLELEPFQKVSISDICDRCEMNRKSFYYHFRDKYDLINWLFDTEFTAYLRRQASQTDWAFIEALYRYFYENRVLYRKVFPLRGQNSLFEHLKAYLKPLLKAPLSDILEQEEVPTMYLDFFSDCICATLERWLMDKNCLSPDEYLPLLYELLYRTCTYAASRLSHTQS